MKFFGKLIILVLLSYVIAACNFRQEQLPPDGMRSVLIKNKSVDFEYWLGSSEDSGDKETYQLYITNYSLQDFTSVFNDLLNSSVFKPKHVQAITIYTDTIFSKETVKLIPTTILGLQVYYLEDEYLKTAIFNHDNENFKNIEQLISFVDNFSTSDIHDVSKIFKPNKNSVFIIINSSMISKYKTGKDNLEENLAIYKN